MSRRRARPASSRPRPPPRPMARSSRKPPRMSEPSAIGCRDPSRTRRARRRPLPHRGRGARCPTTARPPRRRRPRPRRQPRRSSRRRHRRSSRRRPRAPRARSPTGAGTTCGSRRWASTGPCPRTPAARRWRPETSSIAGAARARTTCTCSATRPACSSRSTTRTSSHRLKVGLKAYYADARGTVHVYAVTWWRVTLPTPQSKWAWAPQGVPSMTLQTCLGAHSEYRLMVRLVEVGG